PPAAAARSRLVPMPAGKSSPAGVCKGAWSGRLGAAGIAQGPRLAGRTVPVLAVGSTAGSTPAHGGMVGLAASRVVTTSSAVATGTGFPPERASDRASKDGGAGGTEGSLPLLLAATIAPVEPAAESVDFAEGSSAAGAACVASAGAELASRCTP